MILILIRFAIFEDRKTSNLELKEGILVQGVEQAVDCWWSFVGWICGDQQIQNSRQSPQHLLQSYSFV